VTSSKPKLAIVQLGSFRSFPVGGISTFVESVIPLMAEAFDLKLIGMSIGERVGDWTNIQVGGRTYEFLPIIQSGQSKIVPDRVRLAYAMVKYCRAVAASQADAYYVHMTEAAMPLVVWSGRPVIVHVHGLYNLFRFSRHWLGAPFATVYDRFYPALFSRCAKVIGAGTEAEFEQFRRTMRVKSGAAIPTCVRERVFYPRDRMRVRRELGLDPNETVLLYAGRMTETKNPLLLIEAARLLKDEIPGLRVVFVGDGPLRGAVQAQAGNSLKVTVAGLLSAEETARWMSAADALTVVSKAEAFTSIVALEALSCGTPVVATHVSALPDVIRKGVNGVVSDGFAPDVYAEAVKGLLRDRPSAESCRRSVEGYRSQAVADCVIREIREVIGRESSHAAGGGGWRP
jgi:glycosyltransferase involved in cell wall biosynthesis